jgi:uncharacterized protein involved in exopolysaccharide biosynthesis
MNKRIEENELTLINIVKLLYKDRLVIFIITSLFSIFAVTYSLSLNNYYTSSALMAPAQDEDNNRSSILSSMGSLASIAGLRAPSGINDKTDEAIERMTSKVFFKKLIDKYPEFLPKLMAAKDYDHDKKVIVFDNTQYLQNENKWIREVKYPFQTIPSIQESHKEFSKVFSIRRDEQSGFVTASVVHISPIFAEKLLNVVIQEINEITRLKDLSESESALLFLQAESQKNKNTTIDQSLNALIQIEMEKQMLSQISPNYVFEFIDKPFIPELKTGPNRAIICIISFFAGLLLSCAFVLFKSDITLLNSKQNNF